MKAIRIWLFAAALAAGQACANADIFNAATKNALQAVNGSLMSGRKAEAPKTANLEQIGAYQANSQVSHEVREAIIASLQTLGESNGMDAQSSKTLADNLRQVDVPSLIWPELEKMGFPRDNMVTATAFWLVVNWEIMAGRDNDPAESAAIFQQMKAHYAQSEAMAGMSDRDLQYGAEAMIWVATMQRQLYDAAKTSGDAAQIAAAQEDARAGLKSLGFDADHLQLTAEGFVSR